MMLMGIFGGCGYNHDYLSLFEGLYEKLYIISRFLGFIAIWDIETYCLNEKRDKPPQRKFCFVYFRLLLICGTNQVDYDFPGRNVHKQLMQLLLAPIPFHKYYLVQNISEKCNKNYHTF